MMPQRTLDALKEAMYIDPEQVASYLEDFIMSYVTQLHRDGVVLGLSWWLDSAVVAALAKKAVWGKHTLGLILSEKDSMKKDVADALLVAEKLGIEQHILDMTSYLRKIWSYKFFLLEKIPFLPLRTKNRITKRVNAWYKKKKGHPPFLDNLLGTKNMRYKHLFNNQIAYSRIKHRMRLVLLYFYGELDNSLIVWCANKTEHMIGYFVKNGCDAVSDIMPIMNLYKTQVFALAEYLGIPKEIIKKPPTGWTLGNTSDESAIWLPYEQLDLILLALEKGRTDQEIIAAVGVDEKNIHYVKELIKRSEHMRHVYTPQ